MEATHNSLKGLCHIIKDTNLKGYNRLRANIDLVLNIPLDLINSLLIQGTLPIDRV